MSLESTWNHVMFITGISIISYTRLLSFLKNTLEKSAVYMIIKLLNRGHLDGEQNLKRKAFNNLR